MNNLHIYIQYMHNDLMFLDLVYRKQYHSRHQDLSCIFPEILENRFHTLLMFHRDVKAKSVMDGYMSGATCWGLRKSSRRQCGQALSQHAYLICNNVSLLTKYLSAEAVNVCVWVSGKFIHVNISSRNLCLNVS